MKKGLFITFEGPEGSGKSTQVKLLSEFFNQKNIQHITTREPGGTNISEQIRQILLNPDNKKMSDLTELLLYSAARAQHVSEKIVPALDSGKICISDRFSFATLAYQGYGRNIDKKIIETLTDIATAGLKPDIIFLLDIEPETGIKKAQDKSKNIYNSDSGDRLESENIDFHIRVRNGYLELAKKNSNVHVIEFENSIENIHKKIVNIIEKYLCL